MSNNLPFTAQVAILDQYIHSKNPEEDSAIADLILETVRKNADIRRYFFSNRPNPAWIPLLWKADFFTKQPEFEINTSGTFLAFWEAHEFLLSVAADVPEYFMRHLENLESCNEWYKAGAVESLTKLEPALASSAVPRIIGWLGKSNLNWSLCHEASELMMFMAKYNFRDEAFGLFSVLTSPILEPNTAGVTSFARNEANLLEHSPIKDYKTQNVFLIALEKLDAMKLISILEGSLRAAINKESDVTGRDNSKVSYWRSAIEDSEQDLGDSAKDLLLRALRDTLDRLVIDSVESARATIVEYLDGDFEIFRRLAIYFLHRYPKVFHPLVVQELMSFANLDATGIHHEFFLLLQEGFTTLAGDQQYLLINAILQGPPPDELQTFVESVAQNRDVDPDEFRRDYINHWVKNRLWMIKEHLPNDTKQILDNLTASSGFPDHPDFTSWMSSFGQVTDKSPIDEENLLSMTAAELLSYLEHWQPVPERHFALERITWAGLAGSVADIIVANPDKYSANLIQIVLCRPVLSQSIFGHLANDKYLIPEKNWVTWLDLIADFLARQHSNTETLPQGETDDAGALAETYRSMVQLIKRGLQHKDSTLQMELLPKIRDILLILIHNPDPNWEQDRPAENWFGHLDPITVSINRVRPMALEALAIYAIKRAKQSNDGSKRVRWESLVKDAFSRKLDKKEDSSWAVHSIFGKYFPTFYWLDKKWTIKNLDKIFPEDNGEEAMWFFVSAWESFLLGGYRSYLMPLLRNKYLRGIEYLSKGYQTKSHLDLASRFAVHVVIDYCLGEYLLDSEEGTNSLMVNFVIQTNPNIRANVSNASWLVYRDNPKDAEKFWPRIKAFWEWRAKEASINNHSSEFDEEIKNFGNIPLIAPEHENIITLWPLLEGLVPHSARGDGFRYDWVPIEKFLLQQVGKHPARTMQYYKMLYDEITERPKWIYHSDEAKELIYKGMNSGNSEAKQITLNLLDNFIRWGDSTFKELYYANAK